MRLERCPLSEKINYGTILKSDIMIEIELLEWLSSALIVGSLVIIFCYKEVKKRHGKD